MLVCGLVHLAPLIAVSADQPEVLVLRIQGTTGSNFGYYGSRVRAHEYQLGHWVNALCSVGGESTGINKSQNTELALSSSILRL